MHDPFQSHPALHFEGVGLQGGTYLSLVLLRSEKEVEVFGHQDVGVEEEVVGAAGAFECLFEDFFGVGVEVGKAGVTTEGDEVEMT